MIWELFVCINATWAGCGVTSKIEYPDKAQCYEALREMRVEDNGKSSVGGNGKAVVAYCRPKQQTIE